MKMPNYFKQGPVSPTRIDAKANVVATSIPDLLSAKVGGWRGFQLRGRIERANFDVRARAIETVRDEAGATIVVVARAEGQQLRAEYARLLAERRTALGNALTANAAAGYSMLGSTRMAATLSAMELRGAWYDHIEKLVADLNLSIDDAAALVATAREIHTEIEQAQDAVYQQAKSAVAAVYHNATASASEIIDTK